MAFENLSDKLQNIFKGLRSKGRLTEADVKEAMKEVKNGQYDFSQTIWGLTETAKECFQRKPYEAYYPKRH